MNSPRRLRKGEEPPAYVPRTRPTEQLLMDADADVRGPRVLCTTSGRAQFAISLAQKHPDFEVTCWFLDVYQRDQAALTPGGIPQNLKLVCDADFPGENYDSICLPLPKTGESELTRDLLQQSAVKLREGGLFIATTDLREDQWLHEHLSKLYPKVTRRPVRKGVTYLAEKVQSPKKIKSHDCEFAFRDGERLIRMKSRPGVFAHRKLDLGARALISAIEPMEQGHVADMGCGSGAVALAAALRHPQLKISALDSNPRAVECTQWAAIENKAEGVSAVLDATGDSLEDNSLDVAYANPPYFSNYKIAGIFLQTAFRALKPGGRFYIVTKAPDWYLESLPLVFEAVTTEGVRGYTIVKCMKSLTGEIPYAEEEYRQLKPAKPKKRKPNIYLD